MYQDDVHEVSGRPVIDANKMALRLLEERADVYTGMRNMERPVVGVRGVCVCVCVYFCVRVCVSFSLSLSLSLSLSVRVLYMYAYKCVCLCMFVSVCV
jgi:hypothetical protein